jgi:hypothetical protein
MNTRLKKTIPLLVIPATVAIALAACSGSGDLSLGQENNKETGGDSGGGDAGNPGPNTGGDSGGGDATPPTVNDSGLSCARPAVDECNAEKGGNSWPSTCETDFASALAVCGGLEETVASCGQYDVVQLHGVDSHYDYYYDHATGQLVAIYSVAFGGLETCVGGPATGFPLPNCGPLTACLDDGGSPSDAPPEAAGPLLCQQSVAAYCGATDSGSSPECYLDWTQGVPGYCGQHIGPVLVDSCGQYDAIVRVGVDTNFQYYYDHTSGNLVAILYASNQGTVCLAGPPSGFIEPACSSGACP